MCRSARNATTVSVCKCTCNSRFKRPNGDDGGWHRSPISGSDELARAVSQGARVNCWLPLALDRFACCTQCFHADAKPHGIRGCVWTGWPTGFVSTTLTLSTYALHVARRHSMRLTRVCCPRAGLRPGLRYLATQNEPVEQSPTAVVQPPRPVWNKVRTADRTETSRRNAADPLRGPRSYLKVTSSAPGRRGSQSVTMNTLDAE